MGEGRFLGDGAVWQDPRHHRPAGTSAGRSPKRAKAFNMRIIVHDPYVVAERAEALGVELVDLDGLSGRPTFSASTSRERTRRVTSSPPRPSPR